METERVGEFPREWTEKSTKSIPNGFVMRFAAQKYTICRE